MLTGTGRRDCSPGWRRAVLVSSGWLSGWRVGESGQVCALDRSQRASVVAEDLRCAHAGPHRRKGAFPTLQPTFKLPNRTTTNSHGGSQRPGSCPRTNYAKDRCASPQLSCLTTVPLQRVKAGTLHNPPQPSREKREGGWQAREPDTPNPKRRRGYRPQPHSHFNPKHKPNCPET